VERESWGKEKNTSAMPFFLISEPIFHFIFEKTGKRKENEDKAKMFVVS